MLAAESVAPDHPAHTWFVERYERVRGRHRRARSRPTRRPAASARSWTPSCVARQLVAMFDGIQLQYLLAGGALDLVAPLRELLDFFTDVVVDSVNVSVLL